MLLCNKNISMENIPIEDDFKYNLLIPKFQFAIEEVPFMPNWTGYMLHTAYAISNEMKENITSFARERNYCQLGMSPMISGIVIGFSPVLSKEEAKTEILKLVELIEKDDWKVKVIFKPTNKDDGPDLQELISSLF